MKTTQRSTKLFIMLGLFLMTGFIIVSWGVYTKQSWVQSLDLTVIKTVQSDVTDTKTNLLSILTEIGNFRLTLGLTVILAIVPFVKRWYAAGIWLIGTILFAAALATTILKKVFDRTRPDFLPLAEELSKSFPSGHTTSATIFYGVICLVVVLLMTKLWQKIIVTFMTLTLIGFVTFTRIYLGVHYPTDVIGGFLYGTAIVFLSMAAYQILLVRFQKVLKRFKLDDQSQLLHRHTVIKRDR